jgi:hypothetical protein
MGILLNERFVLYIIFANFEVQRTPAVGKFENHQICHAFAA